MITRRTILAAAAAAPVSRALAAGSDTAESDTAKDPILGIDISAYPGDDLMRKLQYDKKRRLVGLYLTHWNPNTNDVHTDNGWVTKRDDLAKLGWGFVPTYMGKQPQHPIGPNKKVWPVPTITEGAQHGAEAAALMKTAGFQIGSVVYLDIEVPIDESNRFLPYMKAWLHSVANKGYYPGIYCSYLMMSWVTKYSKAIWMFELPAGATLTAFEGIVSIQQYDPIRYPHGNIRTGAVCTQYLQNEIWPDISKTIQIDSIQSLVADPSDLASVLQALNIRGVDIGRM